VSENYICCHVKIREGEFVTLNRQHVRSFLV